MNPEGNHGPNRMLDFLQGRVSNRKSRLFACVCCRELLHLFPDERIHRGVEVAERWGEGAATEEEVASAASQIDVLAYEADQARVSALAPGVRWSDAVAALESASRPLGKAVGQLSDRLSQ